MERHIQSIKEKIDALKIVEGDQVVFLRSSLHDDVVQELSVIPQFKEKFGSLIDFRQRLTNIYGV